MKLFGKILVGVCVIGLLSSVSFAGALTYTDDFNSGYSLGTMTGQNSWAEGSEGNHAGGQLLITAGVPIDASQGIKSNAPTGDNDLEWKNVNNVSGDYGPQYMTTLSVDAQFDNGASGGATIRLMLGQNDIHTNSLYATIGSGRGTGDDTFVLWAYGNGPSSGIVNGVPAGLHKLSAGTLDHSQKFTMEVICERFVGGSITANIYQGASLIDTITTLTATHFTTTNLDTMGNAVALAVSTSNVTSQAYLDNLSYVHTPEPVTMVLLSLGGIAALLRRRR